MIKKLAVLGLVLLGAFTIVACKPTINVPEDEQVPSAPVVPDAPKEDEDLGFKLDMLKDIKKHGEENVFTILVKEFETFRLSTSSIYANGTAVYFSELKIDGELVDIRSNEDFLNSSSSNMFTGTTKIGELEIDSVNLYKSTPKGFEDKYFAMKGTNELDSYIEFNIKDVESIEITVLVSTSSALKALNSLEVILK